jgi:hypothetical protein
MSRVSFTTKGGNKVKFRSKSGSSATKKKVTKRKPSEYTAFAGKRMKLYIAKGYPASEAMKAAAADWRDKKAGKKVAAKPAAWKGKKLPARRGSAPKKATTRRATSKAKITTRKRAAPKRSRGKFDLDKFLKI